MATQSTTFPLSMPDSSEDDLSVPRIAFSTITRAILDGKAVVPNASLLASSLQSYLDDIKAFQELYISKVLRQMSPCVSTGKLATLNYDTYIYLHRIQKLQTNANVKPRTAESQQTSLENRTACAPKLIE